MSDAPPRLPLVPVPRSLLWDRDEAPDDALWRLARIATRFPAVGADRETVAALHAALPRLDLPVETRILIELYEKAWRAKRSQR